MAEPAVAGMVFVFFLQETRPNTHAAFDPIFCMHHANVDRILSIWASYHRGAWVHPYEQNHTRSSLPS